ncbi:hypothetical protein FQA39_LY00556 [Lamprigera yunnana]|nr:hypothetical protein FQA39_LY00556 [Lamprigera yunnana]
MSMIFIALSVISYFCLGDIVTDIKEFSKNCKDRYRLINTDKGDIFTPIDAVPGQKLILQCHFCKENDDEQPKIWYTMKSLNSQPEEVHLEMDNNVTHNRVLVNLEHSLIFRNFSLNDTGFYYCIGLEGQESKNRYSYVIDAIFENETTPETGNLTKWRKYHDEYLNPVNTLFKTSTNKEFIYIRHNLSLSIEVVTEWESWGQCQVCGRPKNDSKREQKGTCRLKLTPNPAKKGTPTNEDEVFLLDSYELSCRSLLIARLFPKFSNVVRFLPNYIQIEHCEGVCNLGNLSKGWATGKKRDFKYKKSYVLAEHAHLTLTCPESSLETVVVWRKNGKVLQLGMNTDPKHPEREPKIAVDSFNTLYLHDVGSSEEGNYTCQVDNLKMQQIKIFVVAKFRILTQSFVRHMLYLAFVLSLTFSCYCAGLFVTWTKRNSFKSYEELLEENAEKHLEDSDADV